MNQIDFFLTQHAQLHSPKMTGATDEDSIGNFVVRVLDGLSDDEMRHIPTPGMNSMAWIFWHLGRTEDVLVNRVISKRPQVLYDADWFDRLGVPDCNNGTGMSSDEVARLSAAVNLDAVHAYRIAVGQRTREMAHGLTAEQLDEITAISGYREAVAEGAVHANAAWLEQSWVGRTKGYMLGKNAVIHNALHLGEALVIRSQLGHSIPN